MAEDLAADDDMIVLTGNDLDNAFGLADSDHLLVGRKAERAGDRLDPLGFRIGLSVADPCDLGFEEGGDGDNVVVYVIVVARDRLGNDQSLTLSLVGKLCAGGDIACGKDVGHAGAHVFVSDDLAVFLHLDADFLKAHIAGIERASDGAEDLVGDKLLAVRECGLDAAVRLNLDVRDAGAGLHDYAALFEGLAHSVGDLGLVQGWNKIRHHLDDGNGNIKGVVNMGILKADSTGADDDYALGHGA